MRGHGSVTFVLAVVAGTVCAVTGLVYIGRSATAGMADLGPWLATLGVLGGSALGATGLWQRLGEGTARLVALIAVSALAAGYIAANVLALVQGSAAEIPETPRPLHVAGLAVGAALYLVALVEATLAFRGRRGADAAPAEAPHGR